ncbi:MAG: hypothetical protein H6845_01575 [Alphaproteobacteria bacterium]|nr:MAG: hypothetical protein H6845_01575 [Alphaproteobacteria bacterium]
MKNRSYDQGIRFVRIFLLSSCSDLIFGLCDKNISFSDKWRLTVTSKLEQVYVI